MESRFREESFPEKPQPRDDERTVEWEPRQRTPEGKKIKKELKIITPKDFELEKERLGEALRAIHERHQRKDSIEALRRKGIDYSGEREYPTPIYIQMREVVGTEAEAGWSGLVEGIGEKSQAVRRVQTVDEVYQHAKAILEVKQDEQNGILEGIDLAMHYSPIGRSFFVDSEGRHRMFTLKALAELGCDVTISGMKVAQLTKS